MSFFRKKCPRCKESRLKIWGFSYFKIVSKGWCDVCMQLRFSAEQQYSEEEHKKESYLKDKQYKKELAQMRKELGLASLVGGEKE